MTRRSRRKAYEAEPPPSTPLVSSTASYVGLLPGAAYFSASLAATLAPHDWPCRIVRRGFAMCCTKIWRTRSVSSPAARTATPPWRKTEAA
jgi:hypothetical protein